jgi:AcrR family transcriptional regulator
LRNKALKKSKALKNVEKGARRDDILLAAAALFASKGYAATSIRDIAESVGLLSGSLYYHFSSKEEILLEAHTKGVTQVMAAVEAAIDNCIDPWQAITLACEAHLAVLLGPSPFSQVITPQFPGSFEGELRDTLLHQRNEYEALLRSLVDNLALPEEVDRRLFRLALLGALNWTPTWYRVSGPSSPEKIARDIIAMFRRQLN